MRTHLREGVQHPFLLALMRTRRDPHGAFNAQIAPQHLGLFAQTGRQAHVEFDAAGDLD